MLLRFVAYAGLIASAVLFGLAAAESRKTLGTNGALCFLSIVGLGLLAARDITRFLGDRAVDFVYNDDGEGQNDPEYKKAEEVCEAGDPLEAIRMLRAYYEKHPSEIHAVVRIAEIYETSLGNPLAAALEYEEVLKKPLHPERWGWRAIHLVNLYNKIKKPEQANALLEKIATDYAQTAAAKKAREKLGWPEPVAEPEPAPAAPAEPSGLRKPRPPASDLVIAEPEDESESESEPRKPPPGPSLPPGFRPK